MSLSLWLLRYFSRSFLSTLTGDNYHEIAASCSGSRCADVVVATVTVDPFGCLIGAQPICIVHL